MGDELLPGLEDYSDTERAIFVAALEVFARKGKEGARMQEIADAADINKAMLHYYFSSKDELYGQVFAFTMARFVASFEVSLKEIPTFRETLRAFIEAYIRFIRTNENAMRLMVNENLRGGSAMADHLERVKTSDWAPPQVMVEEIQKAVDEGSIRSVDPHHTLLTIISGCIFFFVTRPTVERMHPDATDWEAFVEDRTDHLVELIYSGLERP